MGIISFLEINRAGQNTPEEQDEAKEVEEKEETASKTKTKPKKDE